MFLDKLQFMDLGSKKVPAFCDINTLISIKERYGSIENWTEAMEKAEGDYREVRWTIKEFVNEGISLKNYDNQEDEPLITDELAGAMITVFGIRKTMQFIVECYAKCMGVEDEEENPNLMTKGNQAR